MRIRIEPGTSRRMTVRAIQVCAGLVPLLATLAISRPADAQTTLASAVEGAISNSPRVKMALADVAKTNGILSESRDVYIPAATAGAGLGQSYGYSQNPPTLFNLNTQSLIYNASQFSYIRSARAGLNAAKRGLEDARESVAEDAAQSFLAVEHNQQRQAVLRQEMDYAARLVSIVQDRLDAGQDTRMDLINARLSAAQIRLANLRTEDDTAGDREHLARLMGVPSASIRTDGGFPTAQIAPRELTPASAYASPAVAAAFDTARAKELQARGDSRLMYRPQFSLVVQYNRYATFTDSFKNLQALNGKIGANEGVFGVSVSLPLYDRGRQARNAESAADASRALHEAELAQMNALDSQARLNHTIATLQARAEVASLEQQQAEQQLEIIRLQLSANATSPQPITPKEEQNARISEREKYLGVLDTAFQLHQAQISLLRQTGHLEEWAKLAAIMTPSSGQTP